MTAADDELHPPASDDPTWSETCWFTFSVPERRLSGQLYPFFVPNLGVMAQGVYVWDDTGSRVWDCRYAKNLWHLPMPSTPLSALRTEAGLRYDVLEPLQRYAVGYDDPDAGDLHVDLQFDAIAAPNVLLSSHLDQPGRYTGTLVLDGETVEVDAFGFRDRSWGPRSQVGDTMHGATNGGYSYASASARDGFHAITMVYGGTSLAIHGYVVRDGDWSRLASGSREVVARDPDTGFPTRVVLDLVDEAGRSLHAEGECLNALAFPINPNLLTVNCLTRWTFDGTTAYGEDHDNWSAASARRFFRS